MASLKECREYAEDCLRWAGEAKTEEQQTLLLDMAKYWLKAAVQAKDSTPISGEPMLKSTPEIVS